MKRLFIPLPAMNANSHRKAKWEGGGGGGGGTIAEKTSLTITSFFRKR